MTKLRGVDLFSGCGGMTSGFLDAGIEVLAAFENWAPALEVYRANFDHPAIDQDLSHVDEAVERISSFRPNLIFGGPPCQDFSTAGRRDESRGRAILSIKFSEIVSLVRPRYFVMENVSTIRNTNSFKTAIKVLEDSGYGLTQTVLNAAYCGVPQSRKRMFVVGALGQETNFLEKYLQDGLSDRPMTIHDYLGDSLGVEHYFRVPTNYSRRGVFSIYEPSMTIRAVDRPVPSGYKGHPNDSAPVSEVRALTPKERSLIQTFPDDYIFLGGKSDQNSMIGNAVPVNLAKFVANALQKYVEDLGKQ